MPMALRIGVSTTSTMAKKAHVSETPATQAGHDLGRPREGRHRGRYAAEHLGDAGCRPAPTGTCDPRVEPKVERLPGLLRVLDRLPARLDRRRVYPLEGLGAAEDVGVAPHELGHDAGGDVVDVERVASMLLRLLRDFPVALLTKEEK